MILTNITLNIHFLLNRPTDLLICCHSRLGQTTNILLVLWLLQPYNQQHQSTMTEDK